MIKQTQTIVLGMCFSLLLTATAPSALAMENDNSSAQALCAGDIIPSKPSQIIKVEDARHLAFSPDDKFIVVSSFQRVKLVDVEKRQVIKKLSEEEGGYDGAPAVAYSPDGRTIIWGTQGTIKRWSVDSGMVQQEMKADSGLVTSLAFNRDGTKIVSGYEDGTIIIWDTQQGVELKRFKAHGDVVHSVAFNRDGNEKTIVSGSFDRTIRLWNVNTGEEEGNKSRQPFAEHNSAVYSVAFSPNDKKIVSTDDDLHIKILDVEKRKPLALEGHDDTVTSVALSPDGKTIVSCSPDSTTRVWDVTTGKQLQKVNTKDIEVMSVSFSHDGKTLVTGESDDTIKLWDVSCLVKGSEK